MKGDDQPSLRRILFAGNNGRQTHLGKPRKGSKNKTQKDHHQRQKYQFLIAKLVLRNQARK